MCLEEKLSVREISQCFLFSVPGSARRRAGGAESRGCIGGPPAQLPAAAPPPPSSVPAAAADPPLPRWAAGLGGLAQGRPEGCAEPRAESSVPRPAGSAAPAAQEPRRNRRITRLAETGSGAWVLLWPGALRKKGVCLPSLLERRVLSEKRSEMRECVRGDGRG